MAVEVVVQVVVVQASQVVGVHHSCVVVVGVHHFWLVVVVVGHHCWVVEGHHCCVEVGYQDSDAGYPQKSGSG